MTFRPSTFFTSLLLLFKIWGKLYSLLILFYFAILADLIGDMMSIYNSYLHSFTTTVDVSPTTCFKKENLELHTDVFLSEIYKVL